MVPGESGGNPNAQNPNSTASGLQQFTDPTFQDFLKSPAGAGYTMGQKNTPQAQQAAGQWRMAQIDQQFQTQVGRPATDDELRAGMVLGPAGAATLAANPTGDALKTYAAVAGQGTAQAAFATNGAMLQPGMTSAQALASIGKHYAPGSAQMAAAPGGSPVAGAMGLAAAGPAASAVVGAQQQTPQQVQGLKDVGIPTIDPSLYRSSTSEKLFALSAGLFGAPSLGIGLSRGLGNVTGLMAQDRTNNLRAQSDIIAQARATAQINNQNAMFGLKSQPKPTGVTVPGPNGTDMQEMRDPTTGGLSYVPMPGMVAKDSNAQNRSAVVAGQLNGSTKANQTLAAETVKDTNDGIDNVVASGVNSAQKLQSINNFETLAQDPSSGAGPTLADHARRYLATQLGLGPVDASSAQLTDAMSKQLAAGGFAAIKGVQIKNQREFEFATGQIAKMDTDPRAIVPLIAPMKAAAQHDQNVYQAWRAMPVEQQNAMRTQPGQFQAWKAEQDAPYIDSLGVGGGTSQPTISKTSAGTWAPVTIGGKQVQIGNVSVTPN
jgi:hypothetical protein